MKHGICLKEFRLLPSFLLFEYGTRRKRWNMYKETELKTKQLLKAMLGTLKKQAALLVSIKYVLK